MPKTIIRAKGIIWAAENNNDAYMFEQAGKQINISNAGQWVATAPRRVRAKMMKEDPTLVNDWDEEVGDRMIKVVFIGHDMEMCIRDSIYTEHSILQRNLGWMLMVYHAI